MARPAVVVALPPAESGRSSPSCRRRVRGRSTVRHPDELEALLAQRTRRRGRHPRRRDRLRRVARVLRGSCTRAAARSRRSWSCPPSSFDRLVAGALRAPLEDEYFTRPYSAESLRWRVEAMCIRSQTVDDGSGPILQSGAVELDGWTRPRRTVVAVFNPKGGVGKTTVATNLAVDPPDPPRAQRPARRCRHGHRPRHDVARHRRRAGRSPTAGATRPRAARCRDPRRDRRRRTRPGCASSSLTDSPLNTEVLEPGARGRRDRRGPARLRLHRRRPAPVVQRAQPGHLRDRRPDPRAGHPGRARHPGRRPAARRRRRARLSATAWPWSSTAPTAASASPTWSAPSGCRRWP